MADGFDEVQFPPSIKAGVTGGPGFSTDVIVLSGGDEARNQNWSQARHAWDAATGIKTRVDFDTVIAFFHARNGRARGFRFKDWNDYKVSHVLTTGMQGVMSPAAGDGSNKIFQLQKSYSSGGQTYLRTIAKPIASGLIAYVDGTSAPYTLDTTSGILTFTSAPANSKVVTWDGQFDVPSRFDIDKLDITIEVLDPNQDAISQVTRLPIVEIRV